jgi:hypothetical protein
MVTIVTSLLVGKSRVRIPVGERFCFPKRSHCLWAPTSHLINGYQELLKLGYSSRDVKLTIYHPALRLRVNAAKRQLPLFAFINCSGKTSQFLQFQITMKEDSH